MDSTNENVLADDPGSNAEEPAILEEIEVEDLAVDGICGVY
jgi:mycofactocin precursor